MEKFAMKDRILKYMKDFGSITTLQACYDLGCCDLQHYIMVLRQEYCIADEWVHAKNRWDENVKFKKYWIEFKYDSEGV